MCVCVCACVVCVYMCTYTCIHTHVYAYHIHECIYMVVSPKWKYLSFWDIRNYTINAIRRVREKNWNVNVLTRFNTIGIQCNDLVERDFVSLSRVKHFYYLGVAISRCYECTQISTHGLVKHQQFISNLFQLLKHDLTAAKSWRLNPGSDIV